MKSRGRKKRYPVRFNAVPPGQIAWRNDTPLWLIAAATPGITNEEFLRIAQSEDPLDSAVIGYGGISE